MQRKTSGAGRNFVRIGVRSLLISLEDLIFWPAAPLRSPVKQKDENKEEDTE